ncbi:MAG: hypothetical protein ACR2JO_07480 [Mycobacteriales bacterium]
MGDKEAGIAPELVALLDRLAELSDDELADLEARLVAEFDRLDNDEPSSLDVLAAMTAVAEAVDRVRNEGQRHGDAAGAVHTDAVVGVGRVELPCGTHGPVTFTVTELQAAVSRYRARGKRVRQSGTPPRTTL